MTLEVPVPADNAPPPAIPVTQDPASLTHDPIPVTPALPLEVPTLPISVPILYSLDSASIPLTPVHKEVPSCWTIAPPPFLEMEEELK